MKTTYYYYAQIDENGVFCVDQFGVDPSHVTEEEVAQFAVDFSDTIYFVVEPEVRVMSEAESAVSAAADYADEHTPGHLATGPGVWHMLFLDSLAEQGWRLVRSDSSRVSDRREQ